jgi:hypothetical protein
MVDAPEQQKRDSSGWTGEPDVWAAVALLLILTLGTLAFALIAMVILN